MRPWLDILIKPASGRCDLSCSYCFYRDVAANRQTADRGIMSRDTLEAIVSRAFAEAERGVTFGFQGGEPTLTGLGFYREFISLCKKYNKRALPADFTIQTNGLLLDDEWCAFLREQRFLVGLSLDGDKESHDLHRCGSFDGVLRAARLLEKHAVDFNILCVLTNKNAGKAAEIYSFFAGQGFEHLQFIPVTADIGQPQTEADLSLSAESYGRFLIDIFACWFEDLKRGRYVSIRHIDNWVGMLLGRRAEACAMQGRCSAYACIEADGSVYPCDFYVLDRHCMGNIKEASFGELLGSEAAKNFEAASLSLPEQCGECPHFDLCRGGCRRNREGGGNVFCESYRSFFDAKMPDLRRAAEMFRLGEI